MGVAKAALEATSRYLARDLGPRGVRVNLVVRRPARHARRARHPRLRRPRRRLAAPGAAGLGHRRPGPVAGAIAVPAQRPGARDHRRDPARRRRLPRDGHRARPAGAPRRQASHEAARLPDRRDRLPRHGGARPPARGRRPRGRSRSCAPRDDAAAEARLDGVLAQAVARSVALPRPRARRRRRRHRAGPRASTRRAAHALAEEVGAVLHCAASISFDLPLDEARAINVEGTREVIGVRPRGEGARAPASASCTSRPRTSSGEHAGTFRERRARRRPGVPQHLRADQVRGRALVIARPSDLAPAIARPSIVMGESDTGWTPAFNVLYWPLRAFSRGLFDDVPALADGRVDVVPVDYVADALVHLLDRDDDGRVQPRRRPRRADGRDELVELACDALRPRRARARRAGRAGRALRRPARSTCRTSTWRSCSTTRAPARCSGRPGIRAPRLADYFGDADRLRRGRALGQAPDDPRGGPRARGPRARGGLNVNCGWVGRRGSIRRGGGVVEVAMRPQSTPTGRRGRRLGMRAQSTPPARDAYLPHPAQLTFAGDAAAQRRSTSSAEWSLKPVIAPAMVIQAGERAQLCRGEDVVEAPAASGPRPDPGPARLTCA